MWLKRLFDATNATAQMTPRGCGWGSVNIENMYAADGDVKAFSPRRETIQDF